MSRSVHGPRHPASRLAGITLGLLLAGLLLGARPAAAAECLLVTDAQTRTVVAQSGACMARYSPFSTFKIAIALMAFDAGLLQSATLPVLETEPGLADWNPAWRGPQTPQSWMTRSVAWFSQVLTRRLGPERFAAYVHAFRYGNENVGGVKGAEDGLITAWLSSSLVISPREQVDFLRRMLAGDLPVSARAVEQTRTLLQAQETPLGWTLFGKTGTGYARRPDGTLDKSRPMGWFVGWVEKEGRTLIFARFSALDIPSAELLGVVARRQMLAALEPILRAQSR